MLCWRTSATPATVLALCLSCQPNRVPSAPEIDFQPEMPCTKDDLVVIFVEPSYDEDGDSLDYRFRWFQNGEVRYDINAGVVPYARTERGDYWTVEVWANDGQADGPTVDATTFVFNSLPRVEVSLSPQEPSAADDVVADVEARDADGDEVLLSFSWFLEGELSDQEGDLLPAELTSKGQLWTVEVLPSDDLEDGEPGTSSVSIGNTAPEAPTVSLFPDEPTGGQDDLLCAVQEESYDLDGDEVEYSFSWSVDGVAHSGARTSTILDGDTIPAGATSYGEFWSCVVTPFDGEDQGESAEDEVRIR